MKGTVPGDGDWERGRTFGFAVRGRTYGMPPEFARASEPAATKKTGEQNRPVGGIGGRRQYLELVERARVHRWT